MKTTDENARLVAEIKRLKEANSMLEKKVEEQGILLNWYQEQHRLALLKKYGQSSEKAILYGQLTLFNEAEELAEEPEVNEPEVEALPVASHRRKKKKGKRESFFNGLPTEQVIYELSEDQRVCPCCAGQMHPCGQEVLRKEVEVIPIQVKVTEHVQVVYSCRKCEKTAADESVPMIKSEVPKPVIKGSGIASPSLLAMVLCNKYLLALPLSRQEREFGRLGIDISRQTMANWIIYVAGKWLNPICRLLREVLLTSPENHADETTVQVVDEKGRKASQKSWMWLYCTGQYFARAVVLFEYQETRGNEHPKSFLHGYEGTLHVDGYAGYRCLEEQGVTLTGCWAHVRRKFDEALKSVKKEERPKSLAMKGFNFCNKLFELEKAYDENKLSLEQRQTHRSKDSKKVTDEFFAWCEKAQYLAFPKSTISNAIGYALNQRAYLTNFLSNPKIELSNNRAERSIRPFAVGRKNWLFSYSAKGAAASAVVYSIIETALANGLIPFNYLLYLFERLPNFTESDYPQLMPWHPDVQKLCKLNPPS